MRVLVVLLLVASVAILGLSLFTTYQVSRFAEYLSEMRVPPMTITTTTESDCYTSRWTSGGVVKSLTTYNGLEDHEKKVAEWQALCPPDKGTSTETFQGEPK